MVMPKIKTNVVNDVALVISSDEIEGSKKRDVVTNVFYYVVCRTEGTDIDFPPRLEAPANGTGYDLSDAFRSTLMVLQKLNGVCTWEVRQAPFPI